MKKAICGSSVYVDYEKNNMEIISNVRQIMKK